MFYNDPKRHDPYGPEVFNICRTPVRKDDPSMGSWLRIRVNGRLGCDVCNKAGYQTVWANSFVKPVSQRIISHIIAHGKSPKHQKALQLALGETPGTEFETLGAPSKELLKKVFDNRAKSVSVMHGVEGECGQKKLQKIEFVLAEGRRMYERRFLKQSESIAVHQDGCSPRFVIRFSASKSDLSRLKGHLGHVNQIKDHGTGCRAIRDSMEQIIRNFCTPGFGAPYLDERPGKRFKPALDEAMYHKVTHTIELANRDCAGDELVAGKLATTVVENKYPLLPNCLALTWDKVHGARR